GTKRHAKGHTVSWHGTKLPIDAADGGHFPLGIRTSAEGIPRAGGGNAASCSIRFVAPLILPFA
ncbi:MAG: hypothetical protein OXC62_13850, partial [Aestuariivita sp.]|nr:hypothetical protein [Aestuariivita sp.]